MLAQSWTPAQGLSFPRELGIRRPEQARRYDERCHRPTAPTSTSDLTTNLPRDEHSVSGKPEQTNLADEPECGLSLPLVNLPVGPACQEQGNYGSDRRSDPTNQLHLAPPLFLGR